MAELFAHAAEGLYALALGQYPKFAQQRYSFRLQADSAEELLVSFLKELNFFLVVRRRLLFPFISLQISGGASAYHLSCRAQVTELPDELLRQMQEIKAVTYHQLKIEKHDGYYSATIVFDL